MTLWDKIKTAFAVNKFFEETLKEAKMITNSGKPGWQTSEFYLHLATQAAVLWGAIQGFVPAKWAAIITVAGTAIYTISRTVAKAVADIKTAQANSTTVTTTAPVTTITTP